MVYSLRDPAAVRGSSNPKRPCFLVVGGILWKSGTASAALCPAEALRNVFSFFSPAVCRFRSQVVFIRATQRRECIFHSFNLISNCRDSLVHEKMKWGVEQPCEENITRLLELNCGGLHQVIRIGIRMKLFYLPAA